MSGSVSNAAVHAFLDGDGSDPEAFEDLRRRITLAVPHVLDSAAGSEYATARLAEAKIQGAINALTFAEEVLHVLHDIEDARAEMGALRRRIEQGVTKV